MRRQRQGEIMANAEYKRNCLSGLSAEHWRRLTFSRITTSEEIELSVPGGQTLPRRAINTIKYWFAEDPEFTRAVVLFNEPFLFDPNEVTTGAQPVDIALIRQGASAEPKLTASMVFRIAPGATVEVKHSMLVISTGLVHVNGEDAEDIISPVPMPRITIASNGHITFE
jgi:hypothetical protein